MSPLLAQAVGSITDARVEWPAWAEIWRTLTFQGGYNTRVVVLSATLLGIAAGAIGTFALLRKRALMGDALAHAALPGIALAFLVFTWLGREGRSLPVLLTGATVTGVLGVLCVQAIVRYTRLREDAAIGAVLSVFFGVGVVLLSYIQNLPTGNQGGLNHFIYGQTAAMRASDGMLIGAVAVGAVAVCTLFLKEFRLVCFDDRFGAATGLPVSAIDLLMMALVVVVTVIGLQAVGLILIVALLIIPPAAARFWTERVPTMTVLAAVIGGLSGYVGSCASALLPNLPAGAVIVLACGSLFGVSLLFAPSRGVLAAAARHASLRLRIASDHLLRAIYESMEVAGRTGPGEYVVDPSELAAARRFSVPGLALLTAWLSARGLVLRRAGRLGLTERGWTESVRITRNHRLWEEFLVRHAHLAASHVDRSADLVEHMLSPEIIAELEASLRDSGRTPAPDGIARSVHPIRAERA